MRGSVALGSDRRVVYGASDEKRGYSKASKHLLHPKTKVTPGVMADDCAELMKLFFSFPIDSLSSREVLRASVAGTNVKTPPLS